AALGLAEALQRSGRGDAAHLAERLRALPFVDRVTPLEHLIEVGVDNGSRRVAEVVAQASGNGFTIEDVAVARPSLGDVFLKYTGRALRD
nr:daunorubicin ABC transporter ATP-binding protein [Kouleothrix sp.]